MVEVIRLGVVLSPKRRGFAKFNAGVVADKNLVHMVYRWTENITGENHKLLGYKRCFISYAKLDFEGNLIEDHDEKALIAPYNEYTKGGCEDPRIVEFENNYYMFYTAFDGDFARVGVSKTKDFITIEHMGIIPSYEWDKDAFIFPERINGKIAYVHRLEPDIQIDYVDEIEQLFYEKTWENYSEKREKQTVIKPLYDWEKKKVGGSVPPIKTEKGWLFIYHGVSDDREPFCYRVGAALLDINNPSIVLGRLKYPLLEPEAPYELEGDVNNVVFPQGAYLKDGWIYLSYGAADTYVAMAKINYEELLQAFS